MALNNGTEWQLKMVQKQQSSQWLANILVAFKNLDRETCRIQQPFISCGKTNKPKTAAPKPPLNTSTPPPKHPQDALKSPQPHYPPTNDTKPQININRAVSAS